MTRTRLPRIAVLPLARCVRQYSSNRVPLSEGSADFSFIACDRNRGSCDVRRRPLSTASGSSFRATQTFFSDPSTIPIYAPRSISFRILFSYFKFCSEIFNHCNQTHCSKNKSYARSPDKKLRHHKNKKIYKNKQKAQKSDILSFSSVGGSSVIVHSTLKIFLQRVSRTSRLKNPRDHVL
jgi:hypothetical protein